MTSETWPEESDSNYAYQDKWNGILLILAIDHNSQKPDNKVDVLKLIAFVESRKTMVAERIDKLYRQEAGTSLLYLAPETSGPMHATAIIQILILELDAFVEESRAKKEKMTKAETQIPEVGSQAGGAGGGNA